MPRVGTRWLVVDVGAVAFGARHSPRPPSPFQVPRVSRHGGLKTLVGGSPVRLDLFYFGGSGGGCFPCSLLGKESACSAGDLGSIPGLGRSPRRGHGNPLQYSCLENPHGQRSLVSCSPWGRKESGKSERLTLNTLSVCMYVL